MYKKGSKGWFKHGDFLVLDLICLPHCFCIVLCDQTWFYQPIQNRSIPQHGYFPYHGGYYDHFPV